LKAPSSLTAHASSMELPTLSERVDYEGELAVVIGRKARAVDVDTALDYVLGYVAACDITARDLQTKDGQWARAKSFDGFCPIGPVITRNIDLRNSVLETRVNGKVCQRASLSEMVFSVAEIISHVSTAMTLLPGDVILTGTPDGVGPLRPGDRVVVSITGLEELEFDVSSTRAL
jgi:2-keto-4-pentenoate hydratase/2-oxohepta-3-ene-1,7-dioic acid hydratase in catechol pathway